MPTLRTKATVADPFLDGVDLRQRYLAEYQIYEACGDCAKLGDVLLNWEPGEERNRGLSGRI